VASRLAAWVAIVGGLTLIAVIFAGSTFSRAEDGQRATDLVRAELTTRGLARHRADYELAKSGVDQFYDEALPAFAEQLGMTPQAFAQFIETRYPSMSKLADPTVRAQSFALADSIITNLEQHQHDFEDADAIPTTWLPMTVGPWVGVVAGAALMVAGLWALFRPARLPLALIGILGLSLVLGPLVTRFPQKAHSAERLLATLNVTPAIAAHTRDVLEAAGAALDEMEQRFYPDVAARLYETPQQLDAMISTNFPAVARLRAQRAAVYRRYEHRVEIREAGLQVIPEAKKFPLESAFWWTVVPGALAAMTAAFALASLPKRRANGHVAAGPAAS